MPAMLASRPRPRAVAREGAGSGAVEPAARGFAEVRIDDAYHAVRAWPAAAAGGGGEEQQTGAPAQREGREFPKEMQERA